MNTLKSIKSLDDINYYFDFDKYMLPRHKVKFNDIAVVCGEILRLKDEIEKLKKEIKILKSK